MTCRFQRQLMIGKEISLLFPAPYIRTWKGRGTDIKWLLPSSSFALSFVTPSCWRAKWVSERSGSESVGQRQWERSSSFPSVSSLSFHSLPQRSLSHRQSLGHLRSYDKVSEIMEKECDAWHGTESDTSLTKNWEGGLSFSIPSPPSVRIRNEVMNDEERMEREGTRDDCLQLASELTFLRHFIPHVRAERRMNGFDEGKGPHITILCLL